MRPAFLVRLGIVTEMFSERLECGGSFEAGGGVFWPRLDSFGNLFFGEGIVYLEDGGESFFHLLFACLGLIGKGTQGLSILLLGFSRMEREDNYTSGGALLGRPASSRKEWDIKQKLKKKKRANARAAGHVVPAPDEVLAGQAVRRNRRTPRNRVPKVIKNLGELPSHSRKSRSRQLVSRQSAIHPNLNNISSRISQLGLMSQGSRSLGSRLRGYRSLGSRSRASRSRASRSRASPSPAVAEQPFQLAPATFRFGTLAPIPEGKEDSMGPNKGGRRTRSQRQLRRSRSRRSSRKN